MGDAAAAAPETAMLHTQERDKQKEIGFTDPRRGAAQPTAKKDKKSQGLGRSISHSAFSFSTCLVVVCSVGRIG